MFAEDGYGGGGFDVSGFGNGDTPQSEKKASFRRTEHLVPVTVRQVIESPDSGLKIGQSDVEAYMLKLVGIVKKIDKSSIKITYTLEDNTGSIDGQLWLNTDSDENEHREVVENTYCKVIGSVRNKAADSGGKTIMIHNISPLTDLNEATQHVLEVIHIHYKSSEDLGQESSTSHQEVATGTAAGVSSYAAGFSLNPVQQRVLKAVVDAGQSETGAHVSEIVSALTIKMPLKEVEKILDYLLNEGHIYSTSDDNHFKAIDC